jgi:preprotein translocase subunit SecD
MKNKNKVDFKQKIKERENTKYKVFSLIILILIGFLGWSYLAKPEIESRKIENKNSKEIKTISLGLDLVGGSQLTYDADVSKISATEVEGAMESLRETLSRRLNAFGTSEVSITTEKSSIFSENNEEKRRLVIQIPGVSDVDEAKSLIGKIPLLEFKINLPEVLDLKGGVEDGTFKYQDTGLTGKHLKDANLTTDQVGQPAVLISFNEEGTDLFAKLTGEHIGKQMGIFIDGSPISEPFLRASITNGVSVIEGNFSLEEAKYLVKNLKFGALPVPIKLVSSNTISASLGKSVLNMGAKAALWGLLWVSLFLVFFYRVSGLISVIALFSYIVITLSVFKFLGFVFTAAGIAGFIISVGMAVDANVLIFERIKEELKRGRQIKEAILVGFERAWMSIRDGNMSSILTAVILFYMTTSLVQGFSLTFGFGVLISMFTAIVLTRTFLIAISGGSNSKKKKSLFFGDWDFFTNNNNEK